MSSTIINRSNFMGHQSYLLPFAIEEQMANILDVINEHNDPERGGKFVKGSGSEKKPFHATATGTWSLSTSIQTLTASVPYHRDGSQEKRYRRAKRNGLR